MTLKNILNKIVKIFVKRNANDVHEFKSMLTEIEEEPLNPLGNTIFWLVILFIIIGGCWTYFGKVDVVITAPGIIIPHGGEKVVKALDKGIIYSINIKEGDYVKSGQELVIIKPTESEPGLELNNIHEEAAITMEKIASTKYRLSLAIDRKNRLKEVVDIIPKVQYDEAVESVSTLTHELNSYEATLSELKNKKEQIEKQIQTIKAPVNGYVNTVKIHTIGGVVAPAEELLTIVPENAILEVKAKALNQDIGFIKEGMPVSVKVNTYNFQKYGLLEGKVDIVSPNSIKDEHYGDIYEVFISLKNTKLMVEGNEETVKTGMVTTNEIKIGKRRIIEFFIYPLIKYLDESIKVR